MPKQKMVKAYVANRFLKIGTETREPGELVPEAPTWNTMMHYVHMNHLLQIEVSQSEYDEAVAKYCPDLDTKEALRITEKEWER